MGSSARPSALEASVSLSWVQRQLGSGAVDTQWVTLGQLPICSWGKGPPGPGEPGVCRSRCT